MTVKMLLQLLLLPLAPKHGLFLLDVDSQIFVVYRAAREVKLVELVELAQLVLLELPELQELVLLPLALVVPEALEALAVLRDLVVRQALVEK